MSGNGQAFNARSRRIGAVAEVEIVRRRQAGEQGSEVSGDRDLAHGKGALALLDPEAGGAAAIVAGHQVDSHANQISDIEAVLDVGNELVRAFGAGGEVKIGW